MRAAGHGLLPDPSMPQPPSEPWSPYGLEAHRVALLRRRQRLLLAAIVLGFLGLLAVLATSIDDTTSIDTFGGQGGRVDLGQLPERPRGKPTTLTVAPGRTTVMDQPIQPEVRPPRERGEAPAGETGRFNLLGLLGNLLPPLGGAVWLWRVGKRKVAGPLEQVNLGVYKGAMPLEMVSAQHRRFIFTGEMARASLFGKGREDHLPARPTVLLRRPAARGRAR